MIFISKHDWHLGRIILFGLLKHVKWNLGSARAYVHLFVLQMAHELFGLIQPDNHVVNMQVKAQEASHTRDTKKDQHAWGKRAQNKIKKDCRMESDPG